MTSQSDEERRKLERNRRKQKRKREQEDTKRRRKLSAEAEKKIRIRSKPAVKESLDRLFLTLTKSLPVAHIRNEIPESTQVLIHPRLLKYARGYWRQKIINYTGALKTVSSIGLRTGNAA